MHICAYLTRPQKSPPNLTLQAVEAQLIPVGPWYGLAANIGASAGLGQQLGFAAERRSVGQRGRMRLFLGTAVAGVLGAVLGFAAQWPISLLHMRLSGAGYSGVEPRWDTAFATFDAWSAVLVGSLLAMAAYLLFFVWFPPALVARSVPTLFVFAFLGAIPGLWIGPGAIATVTLFFLAGCVFVARRLSKRTGIEGHPLS